MDGYQMGQQTLSVAISNPPARKPQQQQQFEDRSTSTFTPSLGGGKKITAE